MALEKFTDNQGVKIRYLDNNPSRPIGLPILFATGIVDVADDYVEALEFFADRRVLVVDLRGRGGSDAPPSGYSVLELAGDLRSVLDANDIGPFHLMTFSRGTTPGLELAIQLPDRVRTVSIGDYLPAEIALPPEFAEQMWTARWRGSQNSTRVQRHALAGIQSASRAREFWAELAALAVPVLVARGSEGGVINDERADAYRQSIPGVEIVMIAGSGHDLFRPSRTAYPSAVLEFIARRSPGT